jgi:drug/metabolite transporter (DMT)-like permease
MAGIWVMKFLTPFSVSLSTNMEPIYTIIIALILDWFRGTTKERMSTEFYIGAAIILVAIGVHAYFKTKKFKVEEMG